MNGEMPWKSKKLIGAIGAMLTIAGMVIGSIALDLEEAVTASVSIAGIDAPVLFWAIIACAGLGGFHVLTQFNLDRNNGGEGSPPTP